MYAWKVKDVHWHLGGDRLSMCIKLYLRRWLTKTENKALYYPINNTVNVCMYLRGQIIVYAGYDYTKCDLKKIKVLHIIWYKIVQR
jgi:hypothetical protein